MYQLELIPIFRCHTSEREPIQVATSCEHDYKQDRKQETWNCVPDDHHCAGPNIEGSSVTYRFSYTQWDGNQIDQ